MPTTYRSPARDSSRRTARRRIAGERKPREGSPARSSQAQSSQAQSSQAKKAPVRLRKPTRRPTERLQRDPRSEADRPSRWMLVVASLLLVAVVAEAVLLVRGQLEARAEQQRAEALGSALTDAPARAEKAAAALLSYSHTSIEEDISRTTPFLTADYSEDYESTMRDVVAGPAKQTKATVTAEVLSTAVVDAGPERTDVLVFVNQETESTNSDEPRTALNRAILTMVKRDGAWVVSNLKGL
jgi:Mce-associated membrane protein